MIKFILLAARRSGTTLVIDCLNSHTQVKCVKRAFGLERKIKSPTEDQHSGGFYLYRTKNLYNRIRYYSKKYDLIDDFLCEDIFLPRDNYSAVGFRLIHEMSTRYPQIADWAKHNDVKIIHLVRENILKTYVSAQTAKVHKMHHPRKGERLRPAKIQIDTAELVNVLRGRLQNIDVQRSMFSETGYMELSYESFVEDRAEQSRRMLNHLEVDASEELVSDLVKINPDSLKDVIQNYDEVAEVLSNVGMEKYLS